jgi:tRNA(Ile2) C34 agmatinyltransferase TiaS
MDYFRTTETAHSGTKMKLVAEFESYSRFDFEGNPGNVDLINIKKENGKLVCKRASIRHIGRFLEAGELRKGDVISFYGWVQMGKVSHPTRVKVIKPALASM